MPRRLWAKLWWGEEGKVEQDFQLNPAEIWEIHVRKDPFWDQNPFLPPDPETSPNMSRNGPGSSENGPFKEGPQKCENMEKIIVSKH